MNAHKVYCHHELKRRYVYILAIILFTDFAFPVHYKQCNIFIYINRIKNGKLPRDS